MSGNTEIDKNEVPVVTLHDVRGFHVSMNDALTPKRVDSFRHVRTYQKDGFGVQTTLALIVRKEGRPE